MIVGTRAISTWVMGIGTSTVIAIVCRWMRLCCVIFGT